MSGSTDYLGLNKHQLFATLRKSLPEGITKTQNVMEVRDGVLYTWDFQNTCVLTLNVKENRCRENNDFPHQVLLPTVPARFPVELLRVNATNTLLVVAGPSGVLVVELPERRPPHGAFGNNKEMIYCRSHSLDERLLTCHPGVEVRQVRFHPASQSNSHVLVLTCDNMLRLYNIENESAVAVGAYPIGEKPHSLMPCTKSFFLDLLGETAVDFDFGPPELPDSNTIEKKNTSGQLRSQYNLYNQRNDDKVLAQNGTAGCLIICKRNIEMLNYLITQLGILKNSKSRTMEDTIRNFNELNINVKNKKEDLEWPIFLLDGDGLIFLIKIDIYSSKIPKVKGPLPLMPKYDKKATNPACSILCQPSTPPVLCVGTINGSIYHSIVLPADFSDERLKVCTEPKEFWDPPDRVVYLFEGLGLELGLASCERNPDYCCPVFLHADESRLGHYFATHECGVHSISIPALDSLQQYVKGIGDDTLLQLIVNQPSTADYLICTKMAQSNAVNPVIGFAVYYEPTSVIALLASGQVVSSLVVSFASLPSTNELLPEDIENFKSPLKKMLSEPFDLQIQKILKQTSIQPLFKMSENEERSQQECYDLLQRAAQVFREDYFKNHERAREEIEKRVKVLQMLKRYQTNELLKLKEERLNLQAKAENLAEKYEDVKDKEEDLKKRCERLLVTVSRKKSAPSEAEKKFLNDLKLAQDKIKTFTASISKLKNQMKYQEVQMTNWNKAESKKQSGLGSIQSDAIKSNLQDMTNKITYMITEVSNYKKQFGV